MYTLKVTAVVLLAASSLHGTPLFGLNFGFWKSSPAPTTSPAGAKWAATKVFEPKSTVPAAADLLACVNTVATKLGVDKIKETDPALLKDILTNDMHLIEHPKVLAIFKDDLVTPKSLTKMIEDVKKGATDAKHNPAIGVAMCSALEDTAAKVVFENVNPAVIKRAIHHMHLLDRLVQALGDNVDFMEDMHKYLRQVTDKMSGSTTALGRGWAMFKAAGWLACPRMSRSTLASLDSLRPARLALSMKQDKRSVHATCL